MWKTSSSEGTGSGCSAYDAKPSWQTDTGCTKRMESPTSPPSPTPPPAWPCTTPTAALGWAVYGGTSASSPIIAGVYALAGTPGSSDYPAKYPYSHTSNLYDVTSGNNGSCFHALLLHREHRLRRPDRLGHPERHHRLHFRHQHAATR